MDSTGKMTKWVENKIEKIINKDLEEKIVDENSTFDLETYTNNLLDKYFSDDDIRNLKQILNCEPYHDLLNIESENSTEGRSTHDSLESESNELLNFSIKEIIANLESDAEEDIKKSLKVLEAFVEDLMSQSSWNKIKAILQKMLNQSGTREVVNLILKVFQKPLNCPKKPQIFSKGFTTIVEVMTNQIYLYNCENQNTSFEEIYDIKEKEWLCEEKSAEFGFTVVSNQKSVSPEVLIKLMWLLIDCQQQIPVTSVRFNEARIREIIFSFVHLLSSTNTSENIKLSGLELLSVLNPKASWCRCWCHTAVGRSLLCSAFRKYKNFFTQIIEIIIRHMKIKRSNRLPPVRDGIGFKKISPKLVDNVSGRSKYFTKSTIIDKQTGEKYFQGKTYFTERKKYTGFTPNENIENHFSKSIKVQKTKNSSSTWIVENIPKRIVREAVFFHSISLVSCLIQFRSGRALFPVQTTTKKRLISAKDLSRSIIEYLENIDNFENFNSGITYTSAYEIEVSEMLKILKKVKIQITSSRTSAERHQFSYV